MGSLRAFDPIFDRYDDHHEEGRDEGNVEEDHGGEEGGGQEGLEGSGQEECGGDEEGGVGYLCAEVSEPCLGGYLRWQQDASHRGDEEDLDLHQEVQVE